MEKMLKKLMIIAVFLSVPMGFFAKHDHPAFFWHEIPSIDAIFGVLGTVLLLAAKKALHFLISREENFYD